MGQSYADDNVPYPVGPAHLMFDQLSEAVILLEPGGEVAYWSRSAERIFGYGSAEMLGKSFNAKLVPDDYLDEEREAMQQILAAGSSHYRSMRRKKDGTLTFVDISGEAIYRRDDGVRYIFLSEKEHVPHGTANDASPTLAQFGAMLESMPNPMVVVRAGGHLVLANRRAEILFGYGPGELHADGCNQRIETLLSHGNGTGFPLVGRRKDGDEFPAEISSSTIRIGGTLLICTAIRNIDEFMDMERALREKIAALENASSAKDRFLAGVSHELRTPLNAIMGFTGTLLMRLPGPLTHDQEKQLGIIQSSARHLLSLTNDFLDLALIEAGRLKVHPEVFNCRDLIEELADTFLPSAHRKGLEFVVRLPEEDVVVHTDRRALRQILINLVGNAIKFTERGEVSISLDRYRIGMETRIRLSVNDTGIGIAPEDQTKLFQAYTRFDSALPSRPEGTGLGLHLSRKLAELIGGHLSCLSRQGEGTSFTLILDAAPDRGPSLPSG